MGFFDEKSLAREKKSVASSRSSAGGKKFFRPYFYTVF